MARNSSARCLFSVRHGPFSICSFDIDSARWMKFIEQEAAKEAGEQSARGAEGRLEHIQGDSSAGRGGAIEVILEAGE